MSNHFPAMPTDLQVLQLSYLALLPAVTIQPGSVLDYGPQVNGQLVYTVPNLGASFTFTAPGQLGTFDQDIFEAELAASITAVCQVLSSMSGVVLAALQKQVTVRRNWSWSDPTGFSALFEDTMTYPPA